VEHATNSLTVSAKDVIGSKDVPFIGAPTFYENGKLYVLHKDDNFVRNPRPVLDEAQGNLTLRT
jgi:hypothetical protein